MQVDEGNTTFDSRDNCNAIIETASNKLVLACYGTVIPNSVTTLGEKSFYYRSDLTSFIIPSSVESIESMVFGACRNLTSITFDNCCPTFSNDALSFGVFVVPKLSDIYYPAYAYSYFATNEQTNVFTLHPQVKIDREWTTYCATASFDVPAGIEAYVVKDYADGVVTLKRVETINAGEGLLLKPAEVGTFYDATVNSAPAAYESNLLKGVTEASALMPTDGEQTNFIFTNGINGLGFYPAGSGTLPAYKAYLQIPTASLPPEAASKGLSVVIGNDDTSIPTGAASGRQGSDKWYTLDGRQASGPAKKGIYIYQGKKINVK